MGATFGRHSTFWILFVWSLYLSPSNICIGLLDVYEKECQGTADGVAPSVINDVKRYNNMKEMYENCTFVRENLEIVGFRVTGATKYDFNFLRTIREVNGYVLIVANYVEKIRLNRLRVIRGRKTYRHFSPKGLRNFSLYVTSNFHLRNDSIGLKELQLTSLVEITKGAVLFDGNYHLCFGETTIDWKSITENNPNGEFFISATEKTVACNETCHKNCTMDGGRFCWAKGRGDKALCQAERPCGTCRRNCSKSNCKCHTECIGGCRPTGSNASSCVACKNFLRGNECVGNCSGYWYNPDTSRRGLTYMLGMRCVSECPETMLIQGESCVTACTKGYKEDKTKNVRECVLCFEDCPKTCSGTGYSILERSNLAQFNHCTIVDGRIAIDRWSFLSLRSSHLEILKDVEEVTGQIEIHDLPLEVSSLSFLRNLRTIGGNGPSSWSLAIHDTYLKAVNLTSLKQIRRGGVLIRGNVELCYVRTVNWTGILTSRTTDQLVDIKNTAKSTTCKMDGRICSEKCAGFGCWGPGDDNCVSAIK